MNDVAMKRSLIDAKASYDTLSPKERSRLLRRHALHLKYAKAVELYADTDMPLGNIAGACGVSAGGLGCYLRRYCRELVLRRYGIKAEGGALAVKIIQAGGQSSVAHAKYKDAVAACDSLDFIDLNVSQVARKYGLDGTALANFMRVHYPDTLVWREKVRRRLGINDNVWHGARRECIAQYAEAVEIYRTTNMTLPEIAKRCGVSVGGLSQHLRFYHKDVVERKRRERKSCAAGNKVYGSMLGNGRKYCPSPQTEKKYAEALALYKGTALTMKEIVRRTGVPKEGFRFYLHKWHKNLVFERLGVSGDVDGHTDLRSVRRRMKPTAAKYEPAIESLRKCQRPVAKVAAEFGLNADIFREYLRRHEPELLCRKNIVRMNNGKNVSLSCKEKYAEAIRLYATTSDGLRSIAERLGLVYKTVDGFIRRNYPEAITKHKEMKES